MTLPGVQPGSTSLREALTMSPESSWCPRVTTSDSANVDHTHDFPRLLSITITCKVSLGIHSTNVLPRTHVLRVSGGNAVHLSRRWRKHSGRFLSHLTQTRSVPRLTQIGSEVHVRDDLDIPTTHCRGRRGRQLVLTQLLSHARHAVHLGQLGLCTQLSIAPVHASQTSSQPRVCCKESYSTCMSPTLTSQLITDVVQKAVMPDVSAKKEDGIQPSVFHHHSHCYVTCQYGCRDIRA
jgi:hypothetical protein